MKKCLAALFLLVACESDDPGLPVDTVFRAVIIPLDSTCNGDIAALESYAYVDVLYRSDGRVNISHNDARLSGLRKLEAVELRRGGRVFHSQSQRVFFPDTVYTTEINGTVEPDKIDVVWTSTWELSNMMDTRKCAQKVHLLGEPRPFASTENLDGKYRALMTWYGAVCPDTPNPEPRWTRHFELDTRVYAPAVGRMSILIGDQLYFAPGVPNLNGRIDWDGIIYYYTSIGSIRLYGKASGVFSAEQVELDIEYQDVYASDGCPYRLHLGGAKLIPYPEIMDNDYRVAYIMHDDCASEEDSFETSAKLIAQDGEVIELDDFAAKAPLSINAEGGLSGNFEGDGFTVSYNGWVTPPDLYYKVEYQISGGDNSCLVSYEGKGTARYVLSP